MLTIKKLKKPFKKSGKKLAPGEVSEWKKYGVKIVNVGKETLWVDSVSYRENSKKKKPLSKQKKTNKTQQAAIFS